MYLEMVCNKVSCHWMPMMVKTVKTLEWFILVSREQIVNGIDWSISFLAHVVFLVSDAFMVLLRIVYHNNVFNNQLSLLNRHCNTGQMLLAFKGSYMYFWTVKIKLVLIYTFTGYNQTFCSKCKFSISLENQPGKRLYM